MDSLATTAKLYCRIGEVARITGLKPSILRYWETEFCEIAPQKSTTGQRIYSRENIAAIMQIKQLLYQDKMTIAGARSRLRQDKHKRSGNASSPDLRQLVIAELGEIKKILLQ